jgi:hypothetical protein
LRAASRDTSGSHIRTLMARPRLDERAQHSGPLRRNCSLERSPLRDKECDELDLLFELARSRAARRFCSRCEQFDQIGARVCGGLARGRKGCVGDGDTVIFVFFLSLSFLTPQKLGPHPQSPIVFSNAVLMPAPEKPVAPRKNSPTARAGAPPRRSGRPGEAECVGNRRK